MASKEEIQKLAALSRVSLSEEELGGFMEDIETILSYVGKIDALSLANENSGAPAHRNIFREDGVPHEKGAYTEMLTNAFPEREGRLLRVKRILPE